MARILVAPNEDGFGPSSLAEHVVRELIGRGHAVVLRIGSEGRVAFNECLYRSVSSAKPRAGRVCIDRFHNVVELVKKGGQLDEEATLRRFVTAYGARRSAYLTSLPERLDLVIDFGVPTLAAAAARLGLPRFTVFDHRWSTTLRHVLASFTSARPGARRVALRVEAALRTLAEDEARTDGVFLFSPPVAPAVFAREWSADCGGRVRAIPGAFGGPRPGEWRVHRSTARRVLGLRSHRPAVLVSAGGTPVWDDLLLRLVEGLAARDRREQLPFSVCVFAGAANRARLARAGLIELPAAAVLGRGPAVERFAVSENVCVLGDSYDTTYNPLLSAFDWVVSRAGGGTINDALACAVPLLLVEEPGHWQVDQVRRAVVKGGFGLELGGRGQPGFREFWADPAEVLLRALARHAGRRARVRARMRTYPRGMERWVVDEISRSARLSA